MSKKPSETTEARRHGGMLKKTHTSPDLVPSDRAKPAIPAHAPALFQVLVTCEDETDQRAVYERLTEEGRQCRVLIL